MKKIILVLILLVSTLLSAENLFVVNSISQTLSNIDLITNEVVNNFANLGQTPGSAPNKVSFYQDYAYVVITYENCVQKIDLEQNEIRSYIFLEDSSAPNDIIIRDGYAYVSGNGTNRVYRIDLATESVTATTPVGVSPQGLGLTDGYLYVANTGFHLSDYSYEQGTISKIDIQTMSVVNTINVDLNPSCLQVVVDSIYVVCTGNYADVAGKLDVINAITDEVEESIEIGGSPATIAYSTSNKIFMGNAWPAGVYVYDLQTGNIEITPNDNIILGGNSLSVYEDILITVDALDYQQNSIVRLYQITDYTLINDYECGVGATDAKIQTNANSTNQTNMDISQLFLHNYPNPFNPTTTISFSISKSDNVDLRIYNMKGQLVKTLLNGHFEKGNHSVVWDGKDRNRNPVSSGVYLYRIKTDEGVLISKKMLLLR